MQPKESFSTLIISKLFIYPILSYKVCDKIFNKIFNIYYNYDNYYNYKYNICYLWKYKSNTFTADTKKVNPRCIKTNFNISRKIGEVLIESDYFCRQI